MKKKIWAAKASYLLRRAREEEVKGRERHVHSGQERFHGQGDAESGRVCSVDERVCAAGAEGTGQSGAGPWHPGTSNVGVKVTLALFLGEMFPDSPSASVRLLVSRSHMCIIHCSTYATAKSNLS